MNQKTTLITGITGQDGAYLAELLLSKGYKVYGLIRRTSERNLWRLKKLLIEDEIIFIDGDLTETHRLYEVVKEYKFDEIYNLAAMSHVGSSFKQPVLTYNVDAIPVLHFLEAIKIYSPKTKFYQASTSEMFGNANNKGVMIYEDSKMEPVSPYGIAKLFAHNQIRIYRDSYKIFAVSGILFNHESPLRGDDFVTKKIIDFTKELKKHKKLKEDFRKYKETELATIKGFVSPIKPLQIGNLESRRDWGFAKEYVEGMYLMMQQDKPEDFILATGNTHSVREFIQESFSLADIGLIEWIGNNEYEKGYIDNEIVVEVSKEFYRPNELYYLLGDASKAERKLGWKAKTNITNLIKLMLK